jgi:two-component system, LytTR family, response regulator
MAHDVSTPDGRAATGFRAVDPVMPRHGVVLVDDEPLARRRLRQLMSTAPDFEVVGECRDGREVLAVVRATRPTVVFLDIGMPVLDGFAAREAIRALVRHVVFVTAHLQHAARAFDVAATDYLVKPVSQARLDDALQRIRAAHGPPDDPRILLGGRQGGVAVALSDITWVSADGAYVVVYAAGRRHVLRESLAEFVGRVGMGRLVRIHRGAAVNPSHVRGVRRGRPGRMDVELADGLRLPVSRRQARDVLRALGASDRPRDTTGREDGGVAR